RMRITYLYSHSTIHSSFIFLTAPAPTHTSTLSLHDALPIYRTGEAYALNNLGVAQRKLGRYASAVGHLQQALDLHRQLGNRRGRSEEHTSELQSLRHLVCRLLLEKKN